MWINQENIAKKFRFSDTKLLEEFTLFLIQTMREKKMTQAAFAAEIDVDVKTVSRWSTGKNRCSVVNFYNIICMIGVDDFNIYLEDKYKGK